MRRKEPRETRYRLKSIDKIEPKGDHTVKVEATFVEDDRPHRGGRGSHRVEGH